MEIYRVNLGPTSKMTCKKPTYPDTSKQCPPPSPRPAAPDRSRGGGVGGEYCRSVYHTVPAHFT